MSADKTVTRALYLVSHDEQLSCLIRLECEELALPLSVSAAYTPDEGQDVVWLLDLDATAVLDACMRSLPARALGFCREVERLPEQLKTGMMMLQRPFATAQLRACLIQLCNGAILFPPTPTGRPTRFADPGDTELFLSLDASGRQLQLGETTIALTPKEGLLMRCLLERRGAIVSREELESALATDGESNATEVYLCFLRRKLEKPTGLRLIETVRGMGYRLK